MSEWFVYILECGDQSLYTGITTDLDRRLEKHRQGKGAKYTRSRLPVRMVYSKGGYTRSTAAKEEWRIKGLTRKDKLKLIT